MIDLHVHTYHSDGTLSPKKVVLLAKSKDVRTIAITDHDGIDGISEAREWGDSCGVKVIPGIELSTGKDMGAYMHILGYNIDIENFRLKKEIKQIRDQRKERNDKLLQALNGMGYKLSLMDLYESRGKQYSSHYIGKPVFAMALKNKGYINTPKEAFREGFFLRSEEIKKIHREKITSQRGIELIKEAGGIPVLAHPMKISYLDYSEKLGHLEKIERLVVKLKAGGLEGMECYYSKHLMYETEELVKIAERQQLLITAGSDFHGPELDNKIAIGSFPRDEIFPKKEKILLETFIKAGE